MPGLPRAAWLYICLVVALAGGLVAASSFDGVDPGVLVALIVLFLVCDSLPARLHVDGARVSLSFAVCLASVVLLGPVGAALVGSSAVATVQRGIAPVKRVFNGAQFAVSGYAAGVVFGLSHGDRVRPWQVHWVAGVIGPFTLALVTFVLVNLALMAGVLLLAGQAAPGELSRESGELAGVCVGYGMFGLLIAGLWDDLGPFVAVLVMLPLYVARWALEQAFGQRRAYDATLAALCQAVETKDVNTRGHSDRVSRGAVMIARQIGMRPERVEAIRYAGMLHDIGKIGVPTRILRKDGKLTDEEFAEVQLHPMRGLEIVRDIGFLDEALSGILHHHEKMNGRGYPMGLVGDEIPEFARVIGVADAFDVMTSARPYQKPRSIGDAKRELRRCAGTQFDPVMVEAFLRALETHGWEPEAGSPEPARHEEPTPK
ncbi:HD-GYP domain-containing protein [Actinomadura macra]|uniref:HD-GYP domain-containing protein n=1 Tax=Actinomadura macra TaxID=46164 RepID=UPI0008357F79|nr:HD-GYP domain-containing protein [Actinomadura macra]